MKTGFACVSKLLRESSMNPEAIGSEVLIFANQPMEAARTQR
jgi:hypothetical protein